MSEDFEIANPNPSALVESLRSVGYNLPTAIADIIDNSISAEATEIYIQFYWSGVNSWIGILDNGFGMSELDLKEAMRPGAKSPTDSRESTDLGRFGLGLKTASFSQCRQLTVWSKSERESIYGRKWDLDYVASLNEWRLQKISSKLLPSFIKNIEQYETGTLVVWNLLDKLVDDSSETSEEAHQRFLSLIDDVRDYLSMIFHRYISGSTNSKRDPLKIYINGDTTQHLLQAWNPFEISKTVSSYESPTEEIAYKGEIVKIKGYVLPHKDRLNETEYKYGGGAKGWISHQGFYIYRNDRILLAGDWLRLGRGKPWAKEEQYKLARLSIDLPNSLDLEWSLDVKKSTARPPSSMRSRLTGLAEKIRTDAKKVFSHRGQYGSRPSNPNVLIQRPWDSKERNGHITYSINRSHPLIAAVLKKLGPLASEIDVLFRLIEETVPVQRIWLDAAESDKDHVIPYQDIDEDILYEDMRKVYGFLRLSLKEQDSIRAYLHATEPFNRYPILISKLLDEE